MIMLRLCKNNKNETKMEAQADNQIQNRQKNIFSQIKKKKKKIIDMHRCLEGAFFAPVFFLKKNF